MATTRPRRFCGRIMRRAAVLLAGMGVAVGLAAAPATAASNTHSTSTNATGSYVVQPVDDWWL